MAHGFTTVGTSTEEGFVRGDPTANDSYMFLILVFIKNFQATLNGTEMYITENVIIKASFFCMIH